MLVGAASVVISGVISIVSALMTELSCKGVGNSARGIRGA